jgi:squalene cyclase
MKVNDIYTIQLFNPVEFLENVVVEHDYVECTSSTIQALAMLKRTLPGHRENEIDSFITKAVHYIQSKQNTDGSWCVYIYTDSQ